MGQSAPSTIRPSCRRAFRVLPPAVVDAANLNKLSDNRGEEIG
jgi:hypothetical protein